LHQDGRGASASAREQGSRKIRAYSMAQARYLKAADNLIAIGITATTNPMGAGKWRDDFGEFPRGADVVVLPDNDPQSMSHTGVFVPA